MSKKWRDPLTAFAWECIEVLIALVAVIICLWFLGYYATANGYIRW
jgi:hypothetical protein